MRYILRRVIDEFTPSVNH